MAILQRGDLPGGVSSESLCTVLVNCGVSAEMAQAYTEFMARIEAESRWEQGEGRSRAMKLEFTV